MRVRLMFALACLALSCGPGGSPGSPCPPCAGDTPRCDPAARRCVGCLVDSHCGLGTVCKAGACVPGCAAGRSCGDAGVCEVDGGRCVGCLADGDCGGMTPRCDKSVSRCVPCLQEGDNCPAGRRCVGGNGVYACMPGCKVDADCAADGGSLSCCGGACVDVTGTNPHCGACGKACGNNQVCCNAACTDLSTDPMSCGACGAKCALAGAQSMCVGGQCRLTTCLMGFGDCDQAAQNGCETDLSSATAHCGGCNKACVVAHATPKCTAGACAISSCTAPWGDCNNQPGDGCEVDTSTNNAHCGGCNKPCTIANGTGACVGGKCTVASCSGSYRDCDNNPQNGCESDITADAKNCGACGNACAGRCGTQVLASMQVPPPGWTWNGNAFHDAGAASAVLTTENGGTGTLMYDQAILADRFEASFEVRIGGGSGADGFGFAWHKSGRTAVGNAGGGLAIAGLSGWGLEFDTYNNNECGDTSSNHIAIDSLTACGGGAPTHLVAANGVPPLRNSGWHAVLVTLNNGVISARLDGVEYFTNYSIPGWAAAPSWFGFGASTGGFTDRHEVRNVKLTFPTPRCM